MKNKVAPQTSKGAAVHVALFLTYRVALLDASIHYIEVGALFLNTGKIDSHFHVFYLIPFTLLAAFVKLFGDPRIPFVVFSIYSCAHNFVCAIQIDVPHSFFVGRDRKA